MTVVDGHGGYVPLYRIDRDDVASQHGSSARGETAIPNMDENHLTMASEATSIAVNRSDIDGSDLCAVFSASVSDPFAEHGIAAHVAYRHGAEGDVRTGDFAGSSRAATDALATASAFVESTGGPALVVCVDILPAFRGSDEESTSGAGAGAVILRPSADDPACHLDGVDPVTTGFVERHRRHGEEAISDDERFETKYGFGVRAAPGLEETVADFEPDLAVVGTPVRRLVRDVLGHLPESVTHRTTYDSVGYAGAASFVLDLVDQLEHGTPDEQLLGVNVGPGGLDCVRLTLSTGVGDEPGMSVVDHIESKEYVTYANHLKYREQREYDSVSF